MLKLDDEDVKFLPLPVSGATSCGVIGDVAVFGTTNGRIVLSKIAIGPLSRPMIALHGTEVALTDDDTSVDCIVPNASSKLLACFTHGNIITILQLRSKKKSANEIPIPAEICRLTLPQLDETELVYTNRATAHCWCDKNNLLVGCFNGSIVRIFIEEREYSTHVVLTEPAPIMQLGWSGQLLVISTLARSCVAPQFCVDSDDGAGLIQIGQKNRDEGFFGACFVPSTNRVYSARHNNRVFEADCSTGSVFKTFRLPDGAPLGLLLATEGNNNDSSVTTASPDDPNTEIVLWSEAPGFVAVLGLSANSTCRAFRELPEDAQLICSVRFQNFILCLLGNDTIMTVLAGEPVSEADEPVAQTAAPPAAPPPPPPLPVTVKVAEEAPTANSSPVSVTDAPQAVAVPTKTTRRVSIVKKVSLRKKVAKKGESDETIPAVAAEEQTTSQEPPSSVVAEQLSGSQSNDYVSTPKSSSSPIERKEVPHDISPSLGPSAETQPPPSAIIMPPLAPESTAAVLEERPATPPMREPTPTKPEVFSKFESDLLKLYRTYSACVLDKKAQPGLLKEITQLAQLCRERQKDTREKTDEKLAAYARDFFSCDAEDEYGWSSKIRTLLLAAIEWLPHVSVSNATLSSVDTAMLLLDILMALPAVELELKCEACERSVEALSEHEDFFPVVHRFSFRCVLMMNSNCLPQLDVPATDSWAPESPTLSPLERGLIVGDPAAVGLLSAESQPLCFAHYYFPYLVAVLPSKAACFVLDRFPKLSIRFTQWACSGHVQSQVVAALRKCGCKLNRLSPDDLADCSCDIVLSLLHQFRDMIVNHGKCFEKCIEVLLDRRNTILSVESVTPSQLLTTKKVRRLEETVIDMLRSSTLNLALLFPKLRAMMDRLSFPLGAVELNAVGATILDQIQSDRIDLLLPLFQLPDVITESHWIALFTGAHQHNQMDKAMLLCLTVVNAPKRVRYLIRRAFPQLDEPLQTDQQLKEVAKKLTVLIGPY